MPASSQTGWAAEELVYCSNVHPGESLPEVLHSLQDYIAGVRKRRGLQWSGSGLWLSASLAGELVDDVSAQAGLQGRLSDTGTCLFTLNGFPCGDFHAASVKQRVYQPDWSQIERYDYTLRLAGILANCLPAGISEGTISTLPLGYRPDWNQGKHEAATQALCRLASELHQLYQRNGQAIRVCLEMEPGCVLESTPETIEFFTRQLPAAAELTGTPLEHIDRHLGVCYDVCHQAVMFEQPSESIAGLVAAGIHIGKIQISSALEVARPHASDTRRLLQDFAEPRYLHQVRSRGSDGQLHGVMDLPDAFDSEHLAREHPWRIHFHVPVQTTTLCAGALGTTQHEICKVLDFLAANPELHPHLEVETYTWQVLPEALRPRNDKQLIAGLATELDWLAGELRHRGMLIE